jgi:tetratricopeptide (TPR) repeat protein
MAALLVKAYDRKNLRLPVLILIVVFSIFFIGRTWLRAADWKNNYTLAESTLKVSPNSPRFNNMMGLELRALGRNQEALIFFEKAVKGNPNHVPALVNLGTEYKTFNRLSEAAAILEKALAIDPSTLATYVNLMSIYRDMNNHDQSLVIAKKAVERFPQSAAVLWNAANAYQLTHDMVKADELRARARAIQPNIGK